MLQDPKLAEEFEANEMQEDDDSIDEDDSSNSKVADRLARSKRKIKAKDTKCIGHSCSSMKAADSWPFDHQEAESSKSIENVRKQPIRT